VCINKLINKILSLLSSKTYQNVSNRPYLIHVLGSLPSPTIIGPKPFYGQQNKSPAPFSPPAETNKVTTNSIWGQNQKPVVNDEPSPPQSKFQLKKDSSQKDFQNKFLSSEPSTTVQENSRNRFSGIPGLVNRAKEGLTSGSVVNRNEQKSPLVCYISCFDLCMKHFNNV